MQENVSSLEPSNSITVGSEYCNTAETHDKDPKIVFIIVVRLFSPNWKRPWWGRYEFHVYIEPNRPARNTHFYDYKFKEVATIFKPEGL